MPTPNDWRNRAKQNLAAADRLLPAGAPAFATAAASRVYYALFQSVVAEYVLEGLSPKSLGFEKGEWHHGGVSINLKRTERLRACPSIRRIYKQLMTRRKTADYGPGFVTEKDVRTDLGDLKVALGELGISP